jgi:Holliday junction resolvase RusA-like endonuclease
MKTFNFFAPGEPKGQPRPRACAFRVGGKYTARMYDAGTSDAWKAAVIAAGASQCPDAPLDGPISVCLTFYFERPKSHHFTGARATLLRPLAPVLHTGKPDADNLAKAILDAMTIAGWWVDDSRVANLFVQKRYANDKRATGCTVAVNVIDI